MQPELTLREGDIVFAAGASLENTIVTDAMRVELIHGQWATCIVESAPRPRFAEYPIASLIRKTAPRAAHHEASR